MKFGDALEAMWDGKKVTRTGWSVHSHMSTAYVCIVDPGGDFAPQLVISHTYTETLRPFAGAQIDILADDWEIMT